MLQPTKMFRAFVAAAAGAALLLGSCASPQKADVAEQTAPAKPKWAHEGTDLAPDPATTFGTLPNGMRYAVRHNERLPGRVAMRFVFDVGSMHEAEDQLGVAHLLEHMAFNGSTNVPEGEVMKMMQRLGAAPGADTNAMTSTGATVYMFNLPNAQDETVDTALTLLRETASELTLAPDAVDRERGVVLSEERLRDSPNLRAAEASLKAMFGDHPAGRSPIGTIEVLKTVPPQRIKDFYDAYYRPERATLLIVGDFDAPAMEAKIKTWFSDWTGRGTPGKDPAPLDPAKAGPDFAMHAEAGLQPQVGLSWLTPLDKSPHTLARARGKVVEDLAFAMLNRRSMEIAQAPNPPFLIALGAKAESRGVTGMTQMVTAGAKTVPGSIDALVKLQRQAVEFGFTQQELDRAITEQKASLSQRAASAATAPTATVIAAMMGALQQDRVFRSARQDLELFEEVAPTVTVVQVNAALRAAFNGAGPRMFVMDAAEPQGGQEAIKAAFDAARAAPVTAMAAETAVAWPYTSFGTPGTIADRGVIDGIGVTRVRFANGVRLLVKPTDFVKDQVQVRVMFGNGQLDMPKDVQSPMNFWPQVFVSGGLNKITANDMRRALAGTPANVTTTIGEGGWVLGGNPRTENLQIQMQVLAAYVTDAAWAPNDFELGSSSMATFLGMMDRTPSGAYEQVGPEALRSGDKRWATPDPAFMRSLKVDDIKAAMAPILKDADLEVVIVGDVDVEEAIRQTAATFGALPPRKPRSEPPGSRDVAFPPGTPQPIDIKHKGRADQGIATIVWPATGFYANQEDVTQARVMQLILVDRLQEELREEQGKTYTVQGGVDFSKVYRTYGTITVTTEMQPADIPGFYAAVDAAVADLKANPPTQDELDRAIKPRREELQRTFITNAYWSTNLIGSELEPRRIEEIRLGVSNYDKVTAATVQAAARRWLVPEKAWKMTVTPQ